jgi:hypothetical protein
MGVNMKNTTIIIIIISFFVFFGLIEPSHAATLYMPNTCSSFSACVSAMGSGDTLVIKDGTYSDSISGVKSNTTIKAENDGKVTFTGTFNPGDAGFTMEGIVLKSSTKKLIGAGSTYRRMSFVGGPSCGNETNSSMRENTKIIESAFYGRGGRYLLLAYLKNGGIVLQDVIFRPDGGWGEGSACNESEPQAALNMYDTEGFTISGAILIDAITTATDESEVLGGLVVNTHESHQLVGTFSQSAVVASGRYGGFGSDGNGSHDLIINDSVVKQNTKTTGLSRNCGGTTTATRFDTDAAVAAWKGSINRTTGANFVLNMAFLNDPRWKKEMCVDSGVTRGFCGTSMYLGSYVANKIGIVVDTNIPSSPTNLRVIP